MDALTWDDLECTGRGITASQVPEFSVDELGLALTLSSALMGQVVVDFDLLPTWRATAPDVIRQAIPVYADIDRHRVDEAALMQKPLWRGLVSRLESRYLHRITPLVASVLLDQLGEDFPAEVAWVKKAVVQARLGTTRLAILLGEQGHATN